MGRSDEGSHSLSDIQRVSSTPDFGVVTPLPPREHKDCFRSDKPSQEIVERRTEAILDLRDIRAGVYVIVSENELPNEIYFSGLS